MYLNIKIWIPSKFYTFFVFSFNVLQIKTLPYFYKHILDISIYARSDSNPIDS